MWGKFSFSKRRTLDLNKNKNCLSWSPNQIFCNFVGWIRTLCHSFFFFYLAYKIWKNFFFSFLFIILWSIFIFTISDLWWKTWFLKIRKIFKCLHQTFPKWRSHSSPKNVSRTASKKKKNGSHRLTNFELRQYFDLGISDDVSLEVATLEVLGVGKVMQLFWQKLNMGW